MPRKLSETEIQLKLQEGRNYKRLYFELKDRFDEVKAENKALRAENLELRQTVATLQIQIAELQAMVFGKKKKPPTGTAVANDILATLPNPPRTKASYRRPIPPAHATTTTIPVPLPETCACGGSFKNVTSHDRYEEDIPLPDLTKDYQAHLVTKYEVERGVCANCGKATSGQDLGGQAVRLGSNVRLLICHLVTVVGLSYAQVANLLLGLYGIAVSDGEIAATLRDTHQTWLPAYEKLKANIRAAPARHYDETPWAIQSQDNYGYAWVMSAANSPNTIFNFATSRGTRHARSLHGNALGVRISDDYGVYRNLPGQQQLCWVHLYRAIRDLRYNANLPDDQLPYVTWWYEQFAGIYQDLRNYLVLPHQRTLREQQAAELWQRLQVLLPTRQGEPEKLTRLKAQLQRAGKARLFTCLPEDTPCDNNRAERDLRQLVLKRKRSFGSKTERGAQALATVLSICTTTWRGSPTGYFQSLALVG